MLKDFITEKLGNSTSSESKALIKAAEAYEKDLRNFLREELHDIDWTATAKTKELRIQIRAAISQCTNGEVEERELSELIVSNELIEKNYDQKIMPILVISWLIMIITYGIYIGVYKDLNNINITLNELISFIGILGGVPLAGSIIGGILTTYSDYMEKRAASNLETVPPEILSVIERINRLLNVSNNSEWFNHLIQSQIEDENPHLAIKEEFDCAKLAIMGIMNSAKGKKTPPKQVVYQLPQVEETSQKAPEEVEVTITV